MSDQRGDVVADADERDVVVERRSLRLERSSEVTVAGDHKMGPRMLGEDRRHGLEQEPMALLFGEPADGEQGRRSDHLQRRGDESGRTPPQVLQLLAAQHDVDPRAVPPGARIGSARTASLMATNLSTNRLPVHPSSLASRRTFRAMPASSSRSRNPPVSTFAIWEITLTPATAPRCAR